MKRFSDFAKPSGIMTGDKIKIENVLGQEVQVLSYKIGDSKHKVNSKVLTLQFTLNGEERILFTGSSVLIDQCETYKNEMPFLTTIEKVDKFYTFK